MDVTMAICPVYYWEMPCACCNAFKGGLQTHRLLYRWGSGINAKWEVAADIPHQLLFSLPQCVEL
jgi:hypothetical protein